MKPQARRLCHTMKNTHLLGKRPVGTRRDSRSSNTWPEIALIGAYPPPYGGVGVHVQRLSQRLRRSGLDFRVYNTVSRVEVPPEVRTVARRRVWWFLWFCLTHRCRIVHLVATNWYSQVLFSLAARWRRGTYILSIHNMMINAALDGPDSWRARLTRWMLRQMEAIIACNTEIARACREKAGVDPERISVIPAFIPPEAGQALPLPEPVAAFCRAHRPLLFSVIWRTGKKWQGQDVYGVDLMVGLLDRLLADHPSAGLVLIALSEGQGAADPVLEEARDRLGEHLRVIAEPLADLTGLYQASDLFLRPTNTDGDANSIREALWLGTPVVASDAVPRPETCVLFHTRDLDDFERQTRSALSNLAELRSQVAAHPVPDNAQAILDLYAGLKGGG